MDEKAEKITLRSQDLAWQAIDEEVVVLDTRSSRYLALKGSGALLWQQMAAGATRDDLVQALVDAYGVTPDRAGADLDVFLDSLTQRGLLSA